MATQALRRQLERVVFYVPSLRCVINQLQKSRVQSRATMSSGSTVSSSSASGGLPPDGSDPLSKWASDPKFPLPGRCAVDYSQLRAVPPVDAPGGAAASGSSYSSLADVMTGGLEDENLRKLDVVKQMIEHEAELEDEQEEELASLHPSDDTRVECTIQSCPEFLRKGFWELFPGAPRVTAEPTRVLTVITICQQTRTDMTCWSEEVEEERDWLTEQFIKSAKEICDVLTEVGFWADFIDPASGLAYHGERTNATLFETDDRFTHLGFAVEDMGCCRVARHRLWGTNVFIGTIFTDAPADFHAFNRFTKRD